MNEASTSRGSRVRKVGKKAAASLVRRRLVRAVPLLGPIYVTFEASRRIRAKGVLRGGVDVGLGLLPVVGRAKAVYELFRGDLIPPQPPGQVSSDESSLDEVSSDKGSLEEGSSPAA